MKILISIVLAALTLYAANVYYYDTTFKADVTLDAETASRACYLDADKNIKSSTVTSTELGFVSGLSSAVQTQLDDLNKLTTNGDILYYNSSAYQRLAVCTNGQIIKYAAGLPACGTDEGAGAISQLAYDITTKSADYTILDDDGFTTILVDDSSTDRTIDLPTVADNGDRVLIIKNTSTDGGKVTIDGEGAEEIDGKTARVLYEQYEYIKIQSNGTSWTVLDRNLSSQFVLLKDVQTDGTDGGSATTGAWRTRTLNTTENSMNWCSLSSNQFTLQPGKYLLTGIVNAQDVGRWQSRVRNITDSTNDIIGSSVLAQDSYQVNKDSTLNGAITITAAKTFEIQAYYAVTKTTTGEGVAVSFGMGEVYVQVTIQKIGD